MVSSARRRRQATPDDIRVKRQALHDAEAQRELEDPLRLYSSPSPQQKYRDADGSDLDQQSVAEQEHLSDGSMRCAKSIRPIDTTTLRLYTFDEAPEWVRGNPYIYGGYRAHYTMRMCLRSIFTIHNETGNVWTHLLGMLFFLVCSVIFFAHQMKPMLTHYAVLIPFALGTVLCMGFSAAYHLFSGHYCHHVYDRMMQLDYFGITCLIVSSFFPPCYFAFQCEPSLRMLYFSMIGVLGSMGLVGPFFGFWAQDRYYWLRLVVYSSMTGSGLFPIVHVNFIMPNGTATPYVLGLAVTMMLYFVGMIIYIFKIPERWFPGRFDLWLHSHQLWHIFVLCAALVHFFNSGSMYFNWEPMEVHC